MKKQENLSPSSQNKIEKMYRAVGELLKEGVDISTIKVSDITGRAGIGKGTAYEYFDTKEEIIANAIHWDMEHRAEELTGRLEAAKGFRAKIFEVFIWIEENLAEGGSCIQFFKANEQSYDVPGDVVREFCRKDRDCAHLDKMLGLLRDSARLEGRWGEGNSQTAFDTALLSAFIGYFIYLSHMADHADIGSEELKEFIYRGIPGSKL